MNGTQATGQKDCSGCGTLIPVDAASCPSCGAQQGRAPGEKSRIAAVLIALFFGGFGLHKFYLGQIGWGIAYLVFFWTFIPSLIAFIEAIIYLTMSDEAFAAKYG